MRYIVRMMIAVLVLVTVTVPLLAQENELTEPQRDLQTLINKIKSKFAQGDVSELKFTEELREFDNLLEKYEDLKTDDVANILFMKAILYIEVLKDENIGLSILEKVTDEFPDTQPAEAATRIIEVTKIRANLKPGSVFPDFEKQDIKGGTLSVSMFRGKVLLLDFWATWCGPCVREMPTLVELYRKYHPKGFEIIGISLDSNKDSLVTFIDKQKITWPQYFDGQGWKNELSGRYGINSIPATFLLDPEGRILSIGLRGEELVSAIKEAVDKLDQD